MVIVEKIEPGIYTYRWNGIVKIEDVEQALKDMGELLGDEESFIALIDMRETKSYPLDIIRMSRVVKYDVKRGLIAYVIVGAPGIIQTVGNAVSKLAPTRYVWLKTWDEALDESRALLQQDKQF